MLPLWQDALGGRFVIGADNASTGWRAVRLELGGIWCVELIEPLAGSAFLDGFFRRHPSGGMHHVTFLVDDVRAAFSRLASRGYEPFGADEQWFQVFVHPRQAGGVLLQLMMRQAGEGRDDGPGTAGGSAAGDGRDAGAGPAGGMTLEDVLAGRGFRGTGLASP